MHMQDQEDAMSSTITIGYSDEDIEDSFDENSSMPEISEESETTDSGKEYPVKMIRAKSTTKDETDAKPKFKKATSLNASSIARLEQYYDGEDAESSTSQWSNQPEPFSKLSRYRTKLPKTSPTSTKQQSTAYQQSEFTKRQPSRRK